MWLFIWILPCSKILAKGLETWDTNHTFLAADWACKVKVHCYTFGRLLPYLFTLATIVAVCFLLRFPLDCSSHSLNGILSQCSSDFPLFLEQPLATPSRDCSRNGIKRVLTAKQSKLGLLSLRSPFRVVAIYATKKQAFLKDKTKDFWNLGKSF